MQKDLFARRLVCLGVVGAAGLLVSGANAQMTAGSEADALVGQEGQLFEGAFQLTTRDKFVKAGEAYFSPDGKWIIFQAVPVPAEGELPDPFYSMYVARLKTDVLGRVSGMEEPIRISPEGSANTCGWFHPKYPWVVMYGSTIDPPAEENQPGYQRGAGRYQWMFPAETEIVTQTVPQIYERDWAEFEKRMGRNERNKATIDRRKEFDRELKREPFPVDPAVQAEQDFLAERIDWRDWLPSARPDVNGPKPLFEHPGYDAEGSWSEDGRYVLYARMIEAEDRPDTPIEHNLDLYIYDTQTEKQIPIIEAPGYDGGPFFSPDGRWICYRSDRKSDNLLQLFVAELEFDDEGVPTGAGREIQLTDNEHVNWGPFWTPNSTVASGALAYATSEVGHSNYEVFAIEVNTSEAAGEPRKRRVTYAEGFDGLPVFSRDGRFMMWTSQRGPMVEGEGRPSSQIWLAPVAKDALKPDSLFGRADSEPMTKDEIIAVARRYAQNELNRPASRLSALKSGDGWSVLVKFRDGASGTITVSASGEVTGFTGGD